MVLMSFGLPLADNLVRSSLGSDIVFGYGVIKLDFASVFQVSLIIESTVVWVNRTGGRHGMQYVGQNFYAIETCVLLWLKSARSYFLTAFSCLSFDHLLF
jgi:hypothetical protein